MKSVNFIEFSEFLLVLFFSFFLLVRTECNNCNSLRYLFSVMSPLGFFDRKIPVERLQEKQQ